MRFHPRLMSGIATYLFSLTIAAALVALAPAQFRGQTSQEKEKKDEVMKSDTVLRTNTRLVVTDVAPWTAMESQSPI